MEGLLPELLACVASFCETNELLKLRSTCRSLRDTLTPIALEHLHIGINQHDLRNRLMQIADSLLAKHVRKVTINTEVLPLLSRSQWERYALFSLHHHEGRIPWRGQFPWGGRDDLENEPNAEEIHRLLCSHYSEYAVDGFWRHFELSSEDEWEWADHENNHSVHGALMQLSSLRSLELVDSRVCYDYARWRDSAQGEVAPCSPWRRTLINPHVYYEYLSQRWRNEGYPPGPEVGKSSEAVFHILAAITRIHKVGNNKPVASFRMQVGHHEPVFEARQSAMETWNPRSHWDFIWGDVLRWFGTLTDVNLRFTGRQFGESFGVGSEIAYCLFQAKALKSLVLDVQEDELEFERYLDGMKEQVWPHLRHLRYSGHITESALHKLITFHGDTIRSLVLTQVTLRRNKLPSALTQPQFHSPRWDSVLSRLRPSLSALERASLHALSRHGDDCWCTFTYFPERSDDDGDTRSRVERCLVEQGAEMPAQEKWNFEERYCNSTDCHLRTTAGR